MNYFLVEIQKSTTKLPDSRLSGKLQSSVQDGSEALWASNRDGIRSATKAEPHRGVTVLHGQLNLLTTARVSISPMRSETSTCFREF